MRPSDDFQDEMRRLGEWSDQVFDAAFRGDSPGRDDELVGHLRAARRGLLVDPPPHVEAAHLSAVVAEAQVVVLGPKPVTTRSPVPARDPGIGWRAAVRGLKRAAVAVAVVAIGGMGSMAGLAYAGVSLPSPALTAFQKIGIHLPNQTQSHGSPSSPPTASTHGQTVRAIATAGPGGCAFGQEVAGVASSKRQDATADAHRQDAAHRPADPCAQGQATPAPTPSTTPGPGGQGSHPASARTTIPSGSPPAFRRTRPPEAAVRPRTPPGTARTTTPRGSRPATRRTLRGTGHPPTPPDTTPPVTSWERRRS